MKDIYLPQFIALITHNLGFTVRQQDWDMLWHKLVWRSQSLALVSVEAYYQLLATGWQSPQGSAEWREVASWLTVTESYFFRDQGQISLLRNQILPDLIRQRRHIASGSATGSIVLPSDRPTLRLWSAGCAGGEEAYSLAILVKELLPDASAWQVVVIGTDVTQSAIERAQQGIYSEWSFRLVSPEIKQKYFRRHREGWEIDPAIRQMVRFQFGNLVQDCYPKPEAGVHQMDLIVCRNVFIYFSPGAIATVLSKFYETLAPHGFLITGHTELQGQNLGQFQLKSFPESVVYQRRDQAVMRPTEAIAPLPELYPIRYNPPPLQAQPTAVVLRSPQTPSHSPVTTPNQADASTLPNLLQEIDHLIKQKTYREAIRRAKQVIDRYPKQFAAHCLLAEACANSGEYASARTACETAIQLNPLAVDPYYLLAQIAEEQNDLEGAKIFLKRVIYLSPSSIYAYLELGALYEQEGNTQRAQKTWQSALDLLQQTPRERIATCERHPSIEELKTYLEKCVQRL